MEKIKWFLYLSATLLIGIPISIVLIYDDVTFSSTFSNTIVSTAMVLTIFGKMITLYGKRKENKSVGWDIGIIIGLFIMLVTSFV